MSSLCFVSPGVDWRVFEKETFQKYFGSCETVRPEDKVLISSLAKQWVKTVFWKLNSESLDPNILVKAINFCKFRTEIDYVNNPRGWVNVHCKEHAFKTWRDNNISCPSWFEFQDAVDFNKHFSGDFLPCLMRVNNSTGGRLSYLCDSEDDLDEAYVCLEEDMKSKQGVPPSIGIGRKIICVKYYDTGTDEYNLSYRLIVAGNCVVAGYARLSPKDDWCCITKKFSERFKDAFVWEQKRCERWVMAYGASVVKAVQCLGLNFQGVDVIIERETKQPYFIEVQPGFSVGYANRPGWNPPFYNPSQPKELVEWLVKDEKNLRQEMPWYYERWLDKRAMFDAAFKALKDYFDGREKEVDID